MSDTTEPSILILKNKTLFKQGETMSNVRLDDNGKFEMFVDKDGIVNVLYDGLNNYVYVSNGGIVNDLTILGTVIASYSSSVQGAEILAGGTLKANNDSHFKDIIVRGNGYFYTSEGCVAQNVTVASGARADLHDSQISDLVMQENSKLYVTGCSIHNLTLCDDFSEAISNDTVISGRITLDGSSAALGKLDLSQADFAIRLAGNKPSETFAITDWSALGDFGKFIAVIGEEQPSGRYLLAEKAETFGQSLFLLAADDSAIATLQAGDDFQDANTRYRLDLTGSDLALTVDNRRNLRITRDALQFTTAAVWTGDDYAANVYARKAEVVVEMKDYFQTEFASTAVNAIEVAQDNSRIVAQQDGTADIFLAEAIGKWGKAFRAQNSFTGQYALLEGKNRFANVFCGAEKDAAILMLTDEDDGIFADDIYTAFEGKRENRLQKLDAICAGGGDDVVDLTCTNVASEDYDSLALYGNDGNDILWGGTQATLIVGGKGNDSMSSQRDGVVFAFDAAWGQDIIHVSSELDFRLWFEEGTEIDVSYDDFGAKVTSGNSNVVLAGIFSGIEDKILIGAADGIQYGGYAYGTLANAF